MRRLTLRFVISMLAMLTLSRLALSIWLWDRVQASGGLVPVMLGGLRIDICMIAMLAVLPAVLSPWLGHRHWPSWITAWWFRLCAMLFVLLEVSSPQFLIEYDTRPNRLYFEYLVNPREVASMLWTGYKGVLFSAFAALLVAAWLVARAFRPGVRDEPMRWLWRPVLSVVLLAVGIMAIRGTLQHRPLNPAMVAFSSDAMINTLPLNGLYSVTNAAYRLQDERSSAALYPTLPQARMQQVVRETAGMPATMIDPAIPSLHRQQATARRDKPLNLVIIVQESLGAQYMKSLGGEDLVPRLEQLAQQGWMFDRAYATGTRSARGLEAISAGFLPTAAEAVLKLPRSQTGFFTLAELLGRHGYTSQFMYGGEAHFDNMRSFFLGNGFNNVIDRKAFTSPVFVGSWGASDEDMFNELDKTLRKPSDTPTFTMAFSVSNHSPWEYPAGRIQPDGNPATVENTVRYVDWAMGEFFDKAKQAPYWKDTVFLVIADHDSRVHGASLIPVTHFHIPALIIGADVAPRRDPRIVSQIDMAPTLLSIMGVDNENPMLGADLTQRDPNRAIMQYGDTFGYLSGENLLVYEPHKSPRQLAYSKAADGSDVFTSVTVDPALAEKALAHALWPSWAYLNEAYRLPAAAK
ncbi:MAG: LTA synthase family protein [Burkholderiaceae bacterium]